MQVVVRGESDRMQQEIQLSPALGDFLEYRLGLAWNFYVERQADGGINLIGERNNMLLGLVIEPSYRKLRTGFVESAGAAPRDALLVGYTDDQPFLALQGG